MRRSRPPAVAVGDIAAAAAAAVTDSAVAVEETAINGGTAMDIVAVVEEESVLPVGGLDIWLGIAIGPAVEAAAAVVAEDSATPAAVTVIWLGIALVVAAEAAAEEGVVSIAASRGTWLGTVMAAAAAVTAVLEAAAVADLESAMNVGSRATLPGNATKTVPIHNHMFLDNMLPPFF